jgi:hypothetical protein
MAEAAAKPLISDKKKFAEHVLDVATVLFLAHYAWVKLGHEGIKFLVDIADIGVIAVGAYFLYKLLRKMDVL